MAPRARGARVRDRHVDARSSRGALAALHARGAVFDAVAAEAKVSSRERRRARHARAAARAAADVRAHLRARFVGGARGARARRARPGLDRGAHRIAERIQHERALRRSPRRQRAEEHSRRGRALGRAARAHSTDERDADAPSSGSDPAHRARGLNRSATARGGRDVRDADRSVERRGAGEGRGEAGAVSTAKIRGERVGEPRRHRLMLRADARLPAA